MADIKNENDFRKTVMKWSKEENINSFRIEPGIVGDGISDLILGFKDKIIFLEIKYGSYTLKPNQRLFGSLFPENYYVFHFYTSDVCKINVIKNGLVNPTLSSNLLGCFNFLLNKLKEKNK
jgi:hypothetical protein